MGPFRLLALIFLLTMNRRLLKKKQQYFVNGFSFKSSKVTELKILWFIFGTKKERTKFLSTSSWDQRFLYLGNKISTSEVTFFYAIGIYYQGT